MGESRAHMELVRVAERYIRAGLPPGTQSCVFVDTPDTGTAPSVYGGYHPDVYVRTTKQLIIGEAKTERDFGRLHSSDQFNSYYEECRLFGGATQIVLAVPWSVVRRALNYFRRLSNALPASNVTIIVLDEQGGVFKV